MKQLKTRIAILVSLLFQLLLQTSSWRAGINGIGCFFSAAMGTGKEVKSDDSGNTTEEDGQFTFDMYLLFSLSSILVLLLSD